jgi:hypothetical protein
MKKTHIQLIIIIGVGYLLVTVLGSRQWDIMVYSLLLLIITGSIVQDILSVFKTAKGIYTDGEVIDAQNDDRIKMDSEKVIVEFISPLDNLKYQIKSDKGSLNMDMATNKKIKVWVNEHNSHKSLVVKEFNGKFAAGLVGRLFFLVVVVILLLFS